jgi:hypothetical protein
MTAPIHFFYGLNDFLLRLMKTPPRGRRLGSAPLAGVTSILLG